MNHSNSDEEKLEEALVDIRTISVRKDLPRDERIAEFLRQIRDPYKFKCGEFIVQVRFTPNGATLEECLAGLIR